MSHRVTTRTEVAPFVCYICCAPTRDRHELTQHNRSGSHSWTIILRVRRCGLCERRARAALRGAFVLGIPLFLLAATGLIVGMRRLALEWQWIAPTATLTLPVLAIGIARWAPVLWLALTDRAGHPLPPRRWVQYSRATLAPEPVFPNPEYDRAFRALNPRADG